MHLTQPLDASPLPMAPHDRRAPSGLCLCSTVPGCRFRRPISLKKGTSRFPTPSIGSWPLTLSPPRTLGLYAGLRNGGCSRTALDQSPYFAGTRPPRPSSPPTPPSAIHLFERQSRQQSGLFSLPLAPRTKSPLPPPFLASTGSAQTPLTHSSELGSITHRRQAPQHTDPCLVFVLWARQVLRDPESVNLFSLPFLHSRLCCRPQLLGARREERELVYRIPFSVTYIYVDSIPCRLHI